VIDPVSREVVCPVAVRFACNALLGAALAEAVVAPRFGLGVELVDEELDVHAVEKQIAVAATVRENRDMAGTESGEACGRRVSVDSLEGTQIKVAKTGIARRRNSGGRGLDVRSNRGHCFVEPYPRVRAGRSVKMISLEKRVRPRMAHPFSFPPVAC